MDWWSQIPSIGFPQWDTQALSHHPFIHHYIHSQVQPSTSWQSSIALHWTRRGILMLHEASVNVKVLECFFSGSTWFQLLCLGRFLNASGLLMSLLVLIQTHAIDTMWRNQFMGIDFTSPWNVLLSVFMLWYSPPKLQALFKLKFHHIFHIEISCTHLDMLLKFHDSYSNSGLHTFNNTSTDLNYLKKSHQINMISSPEIWYPFQTALTWIHK